MFGSDICGCSPLDKGSRIYFVVMKSSDSKNGLEDCYCYCCRANGENDAIDRSVKRNIGFDVVSVRVALH